MDFTKKFRSTSGKPERVINENLDVALVGTDWTVLPSRFHKAAYSAGCESEDMANAKINGMASEDHEVKAISKALDKKARIKDAILRLLEENDVNKFTYYRKTKDYRPAALAIKKIVGFQLSNSERDMVWHKMLEDGVPLPEFN